MAQFTKKKHRSQLVVGENICQRRMKNIIKQGYLFGKGPPVKFFKVGIFRVI